VGYFVYFISIRSNLLAIFPHGVHAWRDPQTEAGGHLMGFVGNGAWKRD
jgi:hypothetical protein